MKKNKGQMENGDSFENELKAVVVFSLDSQGFALHLDSIERVIRVVEVTPLPEVPEIILGVINVQGRIIPVLDIRQRFRLPKKEISLTDMLMIVRTQKRTIAILIETLTGVVECHQQEVVAGDQILPTMVYVEGMVKRNGTMIIVPNLEKLLSSREEKLLDDRLEDQERATV